jgi:glutathione peroxidase-family protein
MIVNASKCTDSTIQDLEAIYKEYQDKDFVIGDFQNNLLQEPGTNEIASFCQMNYGVTFHDGQSI